MDSTYDATNNLAYLSLSDDSEAGKVERNMTLLDTEVKQDIILDFDVDGRLIGIEFLTARESLRPEILSAFRRNG